MYENYFGLKRPPFKISPDTSLFFKGGKRGDILGALVYAIHRGEGIIKVVGEVGSGKTMLCRMLQLKLPKSVEIIYIANPSVSSEDILFVIAHELELPTTKDASKHEVVNLLQDYLLQRHIENKQVVLFIEEAQGMPLDTLEEIRLLSNIETDQHKLLQIILFGQPELDENLSKKSIRQLRERITHNFNLSPLTAAEIHKYLNFRMREVGYAGPELVTLSLAKKVAQYSRGLLRRINIIGDKILLSAFAEGTHNLTSRHVITAVNDCAFGEEMVRKNSSLMWWFGLLIIFALAFGIYKSEALWVGVLAKIVVAPISEPMSLIEKQSAEVDKPANIKKQVVENSNDRDMTTSAQLNKSTDGEAVAMVENGIIDQQPITDVTESGPGASAQKAVVASIDSSQTGKEKDIQSDPEQVEVVEIVQTNASSQADKDATPKYHRWLSAKLKQSREWLSNVQSDKVSIQVMMSKKSSERELVYYLQNEWPLSLDKTYLYEVNVNSQLIYRVFYSEFESVAQGRHEMQRLPRSVKANSPYLHSVHRMQKALL